MPRRGLSVERALVESRALVPPGEPGPIGALTFKAEPGNGLFVAGVQLPLALTELGLIGEFEFFVQPTPDIGPGAKP